MNAITLLRWCQAGAVFNPWSKKVKQAGRLARTDKLVPVDCVLCALQPAVVGAALTVTEQVM